MPRKKVVKEPLEKVKDEVVLEIIEDSSDEEQTAPSLPPPPKDNAIRVSQGNEVISQMTTEDIKEELTPKPRKKRVLSEEQKKRMREGREKKKAEKKALEASKKEEKATPIIASNLTPPPAEKPVPVVNDEEPPRWFKAYLASQKSQHQVVKETEAPVKKARGRPKGRKDTKPRTKKNVVVPEPVAPPKPSIRFI